RASMAFTVPRRRKLTACSPAEPGMCSRASASRITPLRSVVSMLLRATLPRHAAQPDRGHACDHHERTDQHEQWMEKTKPSQGEDYGCRHKNILDNAQKPHCGRTDGPLTANGVDKSWDTPDEGQDQDAQIVAAAVRADVEVHTPPSSVDEASTAE